MRTLILALSFIASAATANDGRSEFAFDVYLDSKPIGYHSFELNRDGDRTILSTEAKFDVKVLFVTAFRYLHNNTEVWENDCLAEIDATTDANGKESIVSGQRQDGNFMLITNDQAEDLAGCVRTFAYWNPSILDSRRLLNSQTGEYEDIEVSLDGAEELDIAGENVATKRYRLTTRRGDILLWYTAEGQQWVALDAPAKGKRRIRYEARQVPSIENLRTMLAGV